MEQSLEDCNRCSRTGQRAVSTGTAKIRNLPRSGSPLLTALRHASSPSSIRNKSGTCFDAFGSRSIKSLASLRRPRRKAVRAMSADESGTSGADDVDDGTRLAPLEFALPFAGAELGVEDGALRERSLSTIARQTSSSV